jgi:hypothetical protein
MKTSEFRGIKMAKDLIETDLGKYAKVKVSVGEGNLNAVLAVPVSSLLDEAGKKVKEAIPGQVDDAIIDLVIATLKGVLAA